MYPFGSGMPQPQNINLPPYNNSNSLGMPVGVPFGAGWIATQQHGQYQQQESQQHNLHYQQKPHYPQQSNPPYPTNMPLTQHHHQSTQSSQHYPPYPIGPGPYPGSHSPAYPASFNLHNPQQAPYPTANTSHSGSNSSQTPYPPSQQHNPHYSHPQKHAPSHEYTPVRTSSKYESPAGNMVHRFYESDKLERHGYGHDHGHVKNYSHNSRSAPFARNEGKPTVFPGKNFDPVNDAQELRQGMRGYLTAGDGLINIICRRTNQQRQEIGLHYKSLFGKDLIDEVKSETSGNFEKLLVGLLRPIVDYYCAELNDAMAGIGTDEEVLIEILCTLSNKEIHAIKKQYKRLYYNNLESELKSETSGHFRRLLVSLCAAERDESGRVDPEAARKDAGELLRAGELRFGTDESTFNMILCNRNYQQLKLIFKEYKKMTGHSLEKAIKKEFSGDIKEGLLAIYNCINNKSEYFASRLHKSMAGIGTNDKQLIRVVITRCEIDMADIKATFERTYGKSLKSWIKGDTSGQYKHALYALIGEKRSK